jgi:hypothetical protein
VYDNRYLPRVIKYMWSASVPVGTRVTNPGYWRGQTIVLRSGPSGLGVWHQETINLYQDYRLMFGEEPGDVQGIAINISADSTGTVAAADYDDFVLLPERAGMSQP